MDLENKKRLRQLPMVTVLAVSSLWLLYMWSDEVTLGKNFFQNMTSLKGRPMAHRSTTKTGSRPANELDQWLTGALALHERFKSVTEDTCNNTCTFGEDVCQAKTFAHWEDLISNGTLEFVPLYPSSKVNQYIFPWEKDYLRHPPLRYGLLLPNLQLSRIYFSPDNGKSVNFKTYIWCRKQDRLVFRVDLIDGYGNHRKLGGDEVRGWITGRDRRISMAGSVEDLGNGTYLVAVTPSWDGMVKLHVAVVYPREYLRAALHHMKEGRHRFVYGMFWTRMAAEVTICHTTPNIPGRPCVCNFTTWNRRPYYCGRPLNKRLSCKDWAYVRSAQSPIATDFTEAEALMAATMSRSLLAASIKHDIIIRVGNNDPDEGFPTTQDTNAPPCADLVANRTLTWTKASPRGVVTRKPNGSREWDSFLCQQSPITPSWLRACLNSTTVWMIGDSNLKALRERLEALGNFTTVGEPQSRLWSKEHVMRDVEDNVTIIFRGHEYPLFHSNTRGYTKLVNQGGVEDFLGKIPSTGSHVIVIHYNLHLSTSHLSAIFQRFLAIRDAAVDLLVRNPAVLVAIRGPHISTYEWQVNHLFGGDVQARFILRLLHEVFKDLRDRIVFLDGMDITTSLNNIALHPPIVVPQAMLRTLLSFKCGY